MRVNFGGIITEGIGKVGGQCIQRGRTGSVLRNITKPITRRNSTSTAPRSQMAYISSYWRLLSPTDRTAWQSLADTQTRYNRFGVPYTPNGYQLFCELNLANQIIEPNEALISSPAPLSFPNVHDFALTADPGGPTISITWTYEDGDPAFKVIPCLYPLQSLGASVPRGSSRNTGYWTECSSESLDITSAFTARFGEVAGGVYQVAVECKIVAQDAGWQAPSVVLITPYSA